MKRMILFALVMAAGCAGEDGTDGTSALVNITDEAPGEACEFGGSRIETGLDEDGDGTLDGTEVESAQFVCDGSRPVATGTRVDEVAAGAECASGGLAVHVGPDSDGSGTLEEAEIVDTTYVCNGVDGADGQDGMDGNDGTNGTDGADGVSTLLDVTPVAPNGACGTAAGYQLESGPDLDGNGQLDAGEVTSSETVCDGVDGGGAFIVEGESSAVYADSNVVELAQVSLTVPGPGQVLLLVRADVYCSPGAGAMDECSPGLNHGYLWVDQDASPLAQSPTGPTAYFFLTPDTTESMSVQSTVSVTAGSYDFYAHGYSVRSKMGFYRNKLTAIYLPD